MNALRLPAESAAAAVITGTAVTTREHGLNPLTDQQRGCAVGQSTGTGRRTETHGAPEDTAQRLARTRNVRLGGRARIEPCALDSVDHAIVTGDGGDECGQPAHRTRLYGALAVEQFRMKPQRGEAAAREPAGAEISFHMGAVDGAAALPQAAGRFSCIVRHASMAFDGGQRRERHGPR